MHQYFPCNKVQMQIFSGLLTKHKMFAELVLRIKERLYIANELNAVKLQTVSTCARLLMLSISREKPGIS